MTLIGARLGPYEIQSALGAGGMGEVYRARDTRLDRSVAIKVLPTDLAGDAERRARFEREARAVATLSHPNICVVHDVGRDNGVDYLVMELLEGETLADRLARVKGPLPLDESLRMAIALAGALAAAHRQGIVHRDLKPANIMLTGDGAKLLDFGLAKRAAPAMSGHVDLQSATATTGLTSEGVVLGSLHYMSPEQVEGREADRRSDVWALSAVLYEMVAGVRAFSGDSPASVLSAILKDTPPPLHIRQPLAPRALERLVATGLAKDPEGRWQDVRDLKRELEWLLAELSSAGGAPGAALSAPPPTTPWKGRGLAGGLLVAGLAIGAVSAWWVRAPSPQAHSQRRVFALAPPDGIRITGSTTLSPEGRAFVFVGQAAQGAPSLWLRSLDTGESRQLTGTDDPSYPFWSPAGDAIGFFADGKLKTISLRAGEPPRVVAPASSSRGGSWGPNGDILFVPETNSPILDVPAAGGEPRAVTALNVSQGEIGHRWPTVVDADHFLYTVQSTRPETTGIYLGSLSAKSATRLTGEYSNTAYADGMLLYVNSGRVLARQLDVAKGAVTAPTEMAGSIAFASGLGHGVFSAVGDVLAYAPGAGETPTSIMQWFDRSGHLTGRLGLGSDLSKYNGYFQQISPASDRVALSAFPTTTADLWIVDIERGVSSRFTFDGGTELNPVWSPDGSQLVYASNRGGFYNLYRQSVASPGAEERVMAASSHQYPTDWSRDGKTIVYTNTDPRTQADIWQVPASGGTPTPVATSSFNEYAARLSPNSEWLAYTSDESGRAEVYLQRFPSGADKRQISTQGGAHPVWRADGRELFYVGADRKVHVVPLTGGATLTPGRSSTLFDVSVDTSLGSMHASHLSVSPDGQRFLLSISTVNETALTAVVNWQPSTPAKSTIE